MPIVRDQSVAQPRKEFKMATSVDRESWRKTKKEYSKELKGIKFKDGLGPVLDLCAKTGDQAFTLFLASKKPCEKYVAGLKLACKTIKTYQANIEQKAAAMSKEIKKIDKKKNTLEKKSKEYSALDSKSGELGLQAASLHAVVRDLGKLGDELVGCRRTAEGLIAVVSRVKYK